MTVDQDGNFYNRECSAAACEVPSQANADKTKLIGRNFAIGQAKLGIEIKLKLKIKIGRENSRPFLSVRRAAHVAADQVRRVGARLGRELLRPPNVHVGG